MAKKKSTPKYPLDFSKNPFVTSSKPTTGFWANNPLPDAPIPAPVDFASILANDPFYQAALANLNAQGIFDKTSRDQAIRQAMIRFGYDPAAVANMQFPEPTVDPQTGKVTWGQAPYVDPQTGQVVTPGPYVDPQTGQHMPGGGVRTLGDILDPTTRSLIQQNTDAGLSIWARLQDAQKQTDKRTVDVLGSRGLFRSGETGYQLKRNVLASDQARYDATNKLMDFLTGAQAAYVQGEMQRQALILQAQKEAADNASNNPPVNPQVNPPTHTQTHTQTEPQTDPQNPHPTSPMTPQQEQTMMDAYLKTFKPKGFGGRAAQPM